ncbi:plasmid pRiA4b ORF-3 family protein [Tahibacter amnicola]|uniref:Plasmid pRiA4b ORF-3 family protein n=1 Tax=Tahibacter amnicola TaxID=2976241 RepID=A0ABY6BLG0_9GAMM|nr:plasmid pRiA4b ORF-3 family protein [Tahibacter amnicola]UXI70312.1 plasmid pRiA4b ORF-3 family protein [Tahibacter amnicola]
MAHLRVELRHVDPLVWREFVVPVSVTLRKLHQILLTVMGWSGGHLHLFTAGHDQYGVPDPDFDGDDVLDEARVRLSTLIRHRKTFTYLYDFGDGWEHKITVKRVTPAIGPCPHPFFLVGENACPPEDIGGPPGYSHFLTVMASPDHESHQEMVEWHGALFDPKHFDAEAVGSALRAFTFRT